MNQDIILEQNRVLLLSDGEISGTVILSIGNKTIANITLTEEEVFNLWFGLEMTLNKMSGYKYADSNDIKVTLEKKYEHKSIEAGFMDEEIS